MSNATSCESILFPSQQLVTPIQAGAIAVQSLPTVSVALVWVTLEAMRRRVGKTIAQRRLSTSLLVPAAIAQGFLTWRIFDVLGCEGLAQEAWRYVAIVGAPLVTAGLLLVAMMRRPRIAIVLSLLLGGATVAADWVLRGGVLLSNAAVPLVASQQLWALHAVVLLWWLPARRPHACAAVSQSRVDALAARPRPDACDALAKGNDRSWSWFAA